MSQTYTPRPLTADEKRSIKDHDDRLAALMPKLPAIIARARAEGRLRPRERVR